MDASRPEAVESELRKACYYFPPFAYPIARWTLLRLKSGGLPAIDRVEIAQHTLIYAGRIAEIIAQ